MPNDTVLSVPAGLTYDLVLEHFIYSCPDRSPWKYDPTDLMTFRTAEGNMEKVFKIERVVSANPADIQTTFQIPEPIRDRITGYIQVAHHTGVMSEPGPYRFYILQEDPEPLPHAPHTKTRSKGAVYFTRGELTAGNVVVNPLEETPTREGKAILQMLVDLIRKGRFLPDDERSFVGYKEAHDLLGLEKRGPHWGNSLWTQGLANLAEWLGQENLPAITGLIIDQTALVPGDGYYEVNGHPVGDREWWMNQTRAAIAFDWAPYVEDDPAPTVDELLSFTRAVVEGALATISVEVR